MTATISLFATRTDFESFQAGQIIFQEGQPGDVNVRRVRGEVGSSFMMRSSIRRTGGIVGEIALIDTKPRSATAVAGPTVSSCHQREAFHLSCAADATLRIQLMRVMADRLRHRTRRCTAGRPLYRNSR